MADRELLERITINPAIFGGRPISRGMRISVETILSLLAQGESWDAILEDYPDLTTDDIRACLAYAHAVIARDSLDPIHVAKERIAIVEFVLAKHAEALAGGAVVTVRGNKIRISGES